jgi:hypothetical protein
MSRKQYYFEQKKAPNFKKMAWFVLPILAIFAGIYGLARQTPILPPAGVKQDLKQESSASHADQPVTSGVQAIDPDSRFTEAEIQRRDQREKFSTEAGIAVTEEYHPERTVIDHPKYGRVVELRYPGGATRYEELGPDDLVAEEAR